VVHHWVSAAMAIVGRKSTPEKNGAMIENRCTLSSHLLNATNTAIASQQSSTASITSMITLAGFLRLDVRRAVVLTDAMAVPEVPALVLVDGLLHREIGDPGVLVAEHLEVHHGWVVTQFLAGP
jgi:hypothetical protein